MISSRYEVLTNPGRTPGAFLPWRVVTGGGEDAVQPDSMSQPSSYQHGEMGAGAAPT